MAFRLTFVSPAGREWRLMHEKPNGVFINESALVGNLVGARTNTPVVRVSRPGHRVSSQDAQVQPITGTLPCTVDAAYAPGRSADEVWREFRADWMSTTPETPGELHLTNDAHDPVLRQWIPVRLEGTLPGPGYQPSELEVIDVGVPVMMDGGLWLEPFSGVGTVTVTNRGVVEVCPRIMWEGAGGTVILPSTAVITLPAVTAPRTLLLDTEESFAVLDGNGELDRDLWLTVRDTVVAEPVPPGATRTYVLPAGMTLEWDIGHLDPWR